MIRIVRKLLILSLIFVIVLAVVVYIIGQADKTISKVDVVSNDGLMYISKQDLIDNVSKLSDQKEWFDFDIEDVEKYIYSIKGVDYALVKKIWPSSLAIYMYDHKPIAYWNNNEILLDNMEIIKPDVFNYDDGELPRISSTDTMSKDYIYETYQKLNDIAKRNTTEIIKISYTGNQFSILLASGESVVLGSMNLQQRLDMFFKSYKKVKDYKDVKYFDMRYSDGFAVKYK